jgi:phage terminase large subunit
MDYLIVYTLNPALRKFWKTKSRYKALYGGRASSKSHDAAGMAVYLAANYTLKFMCARQFQNRISESVYTLIKDKIENSEYRKEFTFTNNSIKHKTTGSEFLFYGIARNLAEIKSAEGIDILWLEEANYLTKDQWEVIEPTIRSEGSQIWLIWNPDELMDFIYQNFVVNPPADCISKKINWQENPYLSETMLKVIKDTYARDPEAAEHTYGGIPNSGADKSVISYLFIEAALDAHKKLGWEPSGPKRMGYDVADAGADKNATVTMHGNVFIGAKEWQGLEDKLPASAADVWNDARAVGATVTYDSIGVGAFVGGEFANLNEASKEVEGGSHWQLSYDPFNAGSGVVDPDEPFMILPHVTITNREHFENAKAQAWTDVATRFRKTYEAVVKGIPHPFDDLISIDKDSFPKDLLTRMMIELSQPRKDKSRNGKFKVESKEDMLTKRGIKSPNLADAAIMAAIEPKRDAPGFFDM